MELNPKDFNRAMPHVPADLDKPTAILFKMDGCGWCEKMQAEWDELNEKVGFMELYTFTIDKNSDNATHWQRITNNLETAIDGFPAIMFYKSNGDTVLYTGFEPANSMLVKMKKFCS